MPATRDLDLAKNILALPNRDRLARLFGPPPLPRPERAFLDSNGFLAWSWYRQSPRGTKEEKRARRPPPDLQKPSPGLCVRFSQLAHGTDEQIRLFAERWGPLGRTARVEEHVDDWRKDASLAAALLQFTADQANGRRGNDEDWSTICESTAAQEIDRSRMRIPEQRVIVALAVNAWFAGNRGYRLLEVVDKQFQVRPGASNLLGVIIAQVAHAITRADELTVCAGCRGRFRPKRPLSHGSRQYCHACRRAKIPQRDAARDFRRRAKRTD